SVVPYAPSRPVLLSFPTRRSSDLADNLALSVVAEAIGRGTPVIVGPSLNAPLLDHPEAQASHAVAADVADEPGSYGSTVISKDRSEEHTSELQSPYDLVCRLLLEK